jgi:hypothetical protein
MFGRAKDLHAFQAEGRDQPADGVLVGGYTLDIAAPLDLAVEALDGLAEFSLARCWAQVSEKIGQDEQRAFRALSSGRPTAVDGLYERNRRPEPPLNFVQ